MVGAVLLTCAARILDWVADLRYCRQTGRAGAWLTVLLKIAYVLMCRILGLVALLRRGDRGAGC